MSHSTSTLGWECPGCGRFFSPYRESCTFCPAKKAEPAKVATDNSKVAEILEMLRKKESKPIDSIFVKRCHCGMPADAFHLCPYKGPTLYDPARF